MATIVNARKVDGQGLVLTFAIPDPQLPGRGPTMLSVDIVRLGPLRDQFAASGGVEYSGDSETVDFSAPVDLVQGFYAVTSLRRSEHRPAPPTIMAPSQPPPQHELLDRTAEFSGRLFFKVEDDRIDFDQAMLLDQIRSLYARRPLLIGAPLHTDAALAHAQPSVFRVVIFCSGAMLHNPQDLEGLSIIPYGEGMDCGSFMAAMNAFLEPNFGRRVDPLGAHDIAQAYAGQTPLFAVVFHSLHALNAGDASAHARGVAADICSILASERGAAPSPFGNYVSGPHGESIAFYLTGYRGNLAPPMTASQHAERLERDLPKMARSPRARLMIQTLAQAIAEQDRSLKYLYYWMVLELAARAAVTSDSEQIFDAHGQIITRPDGQAVATRSARAKVYKFLFDNQMGAASYSYDPAGKTLNIEAQDPWPPGPSSEIIPLWEIIGALAAVRNAVAHTGAFLPDSNAKPGSPEALASRFFRSSPYDLLLSFLEGQSPRAMRIALERE